MAVVVLGGERERTRGEGRDGHCSCSWRVERERVSESGRSLVVEWKSGLDDDFNFIVRH